MQATVRVKQVSCCEAEFVELVEIIVVCPTTGSKLRSEIIQNLMGNMSALAETRLWLGGTGDITAATEDAAFTASRQIKLDEALEGHYLNGKCIFVDVLSREVSDKLASHVLAQT